MQEILAIWNNYIVARQLLIDKEIVRTFNNSVEDFSEFLIAKMLKGELAINVNQEGYDIKTKDKYIQVKSVAKAPKNRNGYIVTSKDRANRLATHYAFVFFDNYIPTDIYIVSAAFVKNYSMSQIKRRDLKLVCGHTDPGIPEITVRYQSLD